MKYEPEIAINLNMTEEESMAYYLLCFYINKTRELIPNYRHPRITTKIEKLKTSLAFKHMMKFVREKRKKFKDPKYLEIYILAQIVIMKKQHEMGNNALVDFQMLHGEGANRRWEIWKKMYRDKNMVSDINYTFTKTNIENEFNKTINTLNKILGDDKSLENYVTHANEILTNIIIKRISHMYVYFSKWIKKLPEEIRGEIKDIINTDALKTFDLSAVKKCYEKNFEYEINMS